MDRRTFLASGLGAGTLLVAGSAFAAWPKDAFESKVADDVIAQLSSGNPEHSDMIRIIAPEIAENGAVVPIGVSAEMEGVTRISILVDQNPLPLTSSYDLSPQAQPYVSTRVKMLKTSNVVALVEAQGKTYANTREVKVTIGGCGG